MLSQAIMRLFELPLVIMRLFVLLLVIMNFFSGSLGNNEVVCVSLTNKESV